MESKSYQMLEKVKTDNKLLFSATDCGLSPFQKACYDDNLEFVELFDNEYPFLKGELTDSGESVVHLSISNEKNFEVFEYFVNNYFNGQEHEWYEPNDFNKLNLFQVACRQGNIKVIKYLLEKKGIRRELGAEKVNYPLCYEIAFSNSNDEVVKTLNEKGKILKNTKPGIFEVVCKLDNVANFDKVFSLLQEDINLRPEVYYEITRNNRSRNIYSSLKNKVPEPKESKRKSIFIFGEEKGKNDVVVSSPPKRNPSEKPRIRKKKISENSENNQQNEESGSKNNNFPVVVNPRSPSVEIPTDSSIIKYAIKHDDIKVLMRKQSVDLSTLLDGERTIFSISKEKNGKLYNEFITDERFAIRLFADFSKSLRIQKTKKISRADKRYKDYEEIKKVVLEKIKDNPGFMKDISAYSGNNELVIDLIPEIVKTNPELINAIDHDMFIDISRNVSSSSSLNGIWEFAVSSNNIKIAGYLLEAGKVPADKIIQRAIFEEKPKIINFLLQNSNEVKSKSAEYFNTAIENSCNNFEILECLFTISKPELKEPDINKDLENGNYQIIFFVLIHFCVEYETTKKIFDNEGFIEEAKILKTEKIKFKNEICNILFDVKTGNEEAQNCITNEEVDEVKRIIKKDDGTLFNYAFSHCNNFLILEYLFNLNEKKPELKGYNIIEYYYNKEDVRDVFLFVHCNYYDSLISSLLKKSLHVLRVVYEECEERRNMFLPQIQRDVVQLFVKTNYKEEKIIKAFAQRFNNFRNFELGEENVFCFVVRNVENKNVLNLFGDLHIISEELKREPFFPKIKNDKSFSFLFTKKRYSAITKPDKDEPIEENWSSSSVNSVRTRRTGERSSSAKQASPKINDEPNVIRQRNKYEPIEDNWSSSSVNSVRKCRTDERSSSGPRYVYELPKTINKLIEEGKIEELKAMLNRENVERVDNGMTPLFAAIKTGNIEIVKVVISKGADITHFLMPTVKWKIGLELKEYPKEMSCLRFAKTVPHKSDEIIEYLSEVLHNKMKEYIDFEDCDHISKIAAMNLTIWEKEVVKGKTFRQYAILKDSAKITETMVNRLNKPRNAEYAQESFDFAIQNNCLTTARVLYEKIESIKTKKNREKLQKKTDYSPIKTVRRRRLL